MQVINLELVSYSFSSGILFIYSTTYFEECFFEA